MLIRLKTSHLSLMLRATGYQDTFISLILSAILSHDLENTRYELEMIWVDQPKLLSSSINSSYELNQTHRACYAMSLILGCSLGMPNVHDVQTDVAIPIRISTTSLYFRTLWTSWTLWLNGSPNTMPMFVFFHCRDPICEWSNLYVWIFQFEFQFVCVVLQCQWSFSH